MGNFLPSDRQNRGLPSYLSDCGYQFFFLQEWQPMLSSTNITLRWISSISVSIIESWNAPLPKGYSSALKSSLDLRSQDHVDE